MAKFLQHLAHQIVNKYLDTQSNLVIVLPSKRAGVFLKKHLQSQIHQPVLMPLIKTMDEIVTEISGLEILDANGVLLEFYAIYLDISSKKDESFENFANWAKILIKDFHDIDRYLIKPNQVFNLLQDIEVLKRWQLEPQDKTDLLKDQLYFWSKLPDWYQNLTIKLIQNKTAYSGLAYRVACNHLKSFIASNTNYYVFAGFNAFSSSESQIVQTLLDFSKGSIYWDIEQSILEHPMHEAGYFVRKIKQDWPFYKTHPFEWVFPKEDLSQKIEIIGAPKLLGQAKVVSEIISNLSEQELQETALVLGSESMLYPVLESLPPNISDVNISMGYPLTQTTLHLLVKSLFKLHAKAVQNQRKSQAFYHKDLLEVFENPWLANHSELQKLKQILLSRNLSYVSYSWISQFSEDKLLLQLTQPWQNATEFLHRIKELLHQLLKNNMMDDLSLAALYSLMQVLDKLLNEEELLVQVTHPEFLSKLYLEMLSEVAISFEGQPLKGLQIMGVLESRTLDFDTVILTNVNEGLFPASKSAPTFVPFDIKKQFGLPTFYEKDAVFAYHFYHLIQRAKKVYLVYNTDAESFQEGSEPSRYIQQLMVTENVSHRMVKAPIPMANIQPWQMPKSDLLMQRLQEIATKGFSPSSLALYLRDPKSFYYQRILSNKEVDEVEESIAANTLGTVIHQTLEQLYQPFLQKILVADELKKRKKDLDAILLASFKEVYKDGNIKSGINYLAMQVAKRYIERFLDLEIEQVTKNQIELLYLEKSFKVEVPLTSVNYPVFIGGNVDRVDRFNGKIRVIDYKTGKVEGKDVIIKDLDNLFTDISHDKILQLSCYVWMLQEVFPGEEIQAGIISFRALNQGFLDLKVQTGYRQYQTIDQDWDKIKEQLQMLIAEILLKEHPFEAMN